jgi:S1-C subfamily serine protease
MAVLKVERRGPCFRLANDPDIVQGTRIYALGFPAASSESLSVEGAIQKSMRKVSETAESVLDESDFRYSITDGIVSLIRREAGTEYIQHSAEISGGNSGGPLIYEDGTVLGINTLATFDEKRPGVGVKYYAISIGQLVADLRRKVPELFAR